MTLIGSVIFHRSFEEFIGSVSFGRQPEVFLGSCQFPRPAELELGSVVFPRFAESALGSVIFPRFDEVLLGDVRFARQPLIPLGSVHFEQPLGVVGFESLLGSVSFERAIERPLGHVSFEDLIGSVLFEYSLGSTVFDREAEYSLGVVSFDPIGEIALGGVRFHGDAFVCTELGLQAAVRELAPGYPQYGYYRYQNVRYGVMTYNTGEFRNLPDEFSIINPSPAITDADAIRTWRVRLRHLGARASDYRGQQVVIVSAFGMQITMNLVSGSVLSWEGTIQTSKTYLDGFVGVNQQFMVCPPLEPIAPDPRMPEVSLGSVVFPSLDVETEFGSVKFELPLGNVEFARPDEMELGYISFGEEIALGEIAFSRATEIELGGLVFAPFDEKLIGSVVFRVEEIGIGNVVFDGLEIEIGSVPFFSTVRPNPVSFVLIAGNRDNALEFRGYWRNSFGEVQPQQWYLARFFTRQQTGNPSVYQLRIYMDGTDEHSPNRLAVTWNGYTVIANRTTSGSFYRAFIDPARSFVDGQRYFITMRSYNDEELLGSVVFRSEEIQLGAVNFESEIAIGNVVFGPATVELGSVVFSQDALPGYNLSAGQFTMQTGELAFGVLRHSSMLSTRLGVISFNYAYQRSSISTLPDLFPWTRPPSSQESLVRNTFGWVWPAQPWLETIYTDTNNRLGMIVNRGGRDESVLPFFAKLEITYADDTTSTYTLERTMYNEGYVLYTEHESSLAPRSKFVGIVDAPAKVRVTFENPDLYEMLLGSVRWARTDEINIGSVPFPRAMETNIGNVGFRSTKYLIGDFDFS